MSATVGLDIIVGHLVGDILLHNRWVNRIKIGGALGIAVHALIAAFGVCLFTGWWDYRGVLAAVAHFLIDYTGVGKKWWSEWTDQGGCSDGQLALDDPAPYWLKLLDDQIFHLMALWLISRL